MSVRQHGTNRPPQEGYSCYFKFAYFSKLCRENLLFNTRVTLHEEFYILLTVHLDAIMGNDQLDALFLMYLFMPLHVSSSKCLSSGGPNCINDDEHLLLETCRGINKYIKKECIK
jgi:hypothetical protein